MKPRHSVRLGRIERGLLAPRATFVSWVMSLPEDDQVMFLKVVWMMGKFEDAGIGLLSEEFSRELQPKESPIMAMCRLCEVDVRRVQPLLEQWGRG
jgi:hypothetical protein